MKGYLMRKLLVILLILTVSLTLTSVQASQPTPDCVNLSEAMGILEQAQTAAGDDPAEALRLIGEARLLLEGIEAQCSTEVMERNRFITTSLDEGSLQHFSVAIPDGWTVQTDEVEYTDENVSAGIVSRAVALPLTNIAGLDSDFNPERIVPGQKIAMLAVGQLVPLLDVMGVLDEADNLADMDSAEDLGQFLLSTIQGDDIKLGEALPTSSQLGNGLRFSIEIENIKGWVIVWNIVPEVYGLVIGFALPSDFESLMTDVEGIAASVRLE
ncbi:MAG TPA: hypothetical protein PLQ56_06380 [Aggregatilineales bacterium]|nr:hypothetical protein [Aggregatilineales bacterium]